MPEFNSVILRQSSTAGLVPDPVEVLQGELAVNLADRKLYSKNSSGQVVLLSAHSGLSGTRPKIITDTNATYDQNGTVLTGKTVFYTHENNILTGGATNVVANRVYLVPIHVEEIGRTIDKIQIVTAAVNPASNFTLGVYANDGAYGPGTRLAQTSSTAVFTGGITYQNVTLNYALPDRGWYWLAAVFSATPSVYCYSSATGNMRKLGMVDFYSLGEGLQALYVDAGSYALPTSIGTPRVRAGGNSIPGICVSFL